MLLVLPTYAATSTSLPLVAQTKRGCSATTAHEIRVYAALLVPAEG